MADIKRQRSDIYVLIGCEESQEICKAFRKLGFSAFSCDLEECSGGHPEWHLKMDVFEAIKLNNWSLAIFHPPCTYLTTTGNRWLFHPEDKDKEIKRPHPKFLDRREKVEQSVEFFMKLINVNIKHVVVENPRGIMTTRYRKPDQYIHPFHFGDPYQKLTGLWLKNLPELVPTNVVIPKQAPKGTDNALWYETLLLPPHERTKARSKTFSGIAEAMANQWSVIIEQD
jgi:hypothetical protein